MVIGIRLFDVVKSMNTFYNNYRLFYDVENILRRQVYNYPDCRVSNNCMAIPTYLNVRSAAARTGFT